MSTKIYNGVKIDAKDINDLMDKMASVRDKVKNLFAELLSCFKEKPDSPLGSWFHMCNLLRKDTDFKFVVFWDEDTKSFYGMHYGFRNDILMDFKWISDFCYFNNTDQPDDVTDEEWQTRKEVWDRILIGENKNGIPSENGMVFELTPAFLPMSR